MAEVRKALIETIRAALVDALQHHRGDVRLASEELMIGRVTLYRKIKELEIEKWEYYVPPGPSIIVDRAA